MSQEFEYVIPPWEAEAIIKYLSVSNLEEIGTKPWFEFHKKLMHLNQQSILEITHMREETIKEWFVTFQKIPVLIYEAIQISVWKLKIFPRLDNGQEPSNTFMLYSVFYHETIAVSLMENILYHCDSVESLDDSALDLIDYAVDYITGIIFDKDPDDGDKTEQDESCLGELLKKKKEIEFDIGMKCISIIGYLSSFTDSLPLSTLKRLLSTHDVPYLFAQLIELHPWEKKIDGVQMIYSSSWEKVKAGEEDKICKVEGQVWFGLRELLLNPKSASYYQVTEFRMSALTKLQKYLHEKVLDQIAPLIDLRRWLSCLNISSQIPEPKPGICVEIIPQIRSSIVDKYRKQWKKIARQQSEYFFNKNTEYVQNMAVILSEAYDLDKIVIDDYKCVVCNDIATKRCSKCKSIWYCGRECQVKDWTNHKNICEKILKARD
ncbi:zinc finger MYND domain-containing protein 10 [Microplitis mediator]|uniref:zinc finger MYND domain-containing protein 10 n=1 Tax=Microplitis mediator TaxID=375433 RepID=UPI0025578E65|nr:zinc finger MYND domain-containing protein 10 [Microplitis mediator]